MTCVWVCVSALRSYGFDDFKPWQRSAVEALLAGRDVTVFQPTGGGKSLTFISTSLAAAHVPSAHTRAAH
jgi:superfamily II DNA helicase RecQ